MPETTSEFAPLPADDLSRTLALAQVDSPAAQHIGMVGDTYTITVSGKDTADRLPERLEMARSLERSRSTIQKRMSAYLRH